MNQKIPGYSAVYPTPSPCGCAQQQPGMQNNSMTIQMPAQTTMDSPAATTQSGVMTGTSQQNTMPSAIQQPTIQGAAMGTTITGQTPSSLSAQQLSPISDMTQPAPMTTDSLEFLNGFLRTQIGRKVKVEFLIGTNTFTDKSGTLIGVGANYILLRTADSYDILT